jgi:DnaJ family protein C protein 1
VFDLVEEVNRNFYEFMEIKPDASSAEIRKAYKKLALILHPDKNTSPDADVQFRQLAGIYEVLKDKELRARYDLVLVEGLPDWRMPAYYFRRMRKIGLAEGLAYLLVIATGIQYCMNYAAHWERKFTISENITAEVKRRQKRLKN